MYEFEPFNDFAEFTNHANALLKYSRDRGVAFRRLHDKADIEQHFINLAQALYPEKKKPTYVARALLRRLIKMGVITEGVIERENVKRVIQSSTELEVRSQISESRAGRLMPVETFLVIQYALLTYLIHLKLQEQASLDTLAVNG